MGFLVGLRGGGGVCMVDAGSKKMKVINMNNYIETDREKVPY